MIQTQVKLAVRKLRTSSRPAGGVLLGRISDLLERRPWIAVTLLVLIYLPATFDASRNRPLWHDELFTYWIAQAPSLGVMFYDLRTHDLNPPLLYLTTRLSFSLLGVNTLATRLPEIVGFLVALLALFQFVRVRLGVAYALFAAGLLLESETASLSVDARPYALMLGCLGIALVGWQNAASETSRRRGWSLSLVFLGVSGMLLSHIFAVLALGALIVAELWRERRCGTLDLPLLAVLFLPMAATLTYIPMLRVHGGAIYPTAFQPDGGKIFFFYIEAISHELVGLCLTAVCALIFLRLRLLRPGPPAEGPRWFFTQPEWVLIVGLFANPLILMAELIRTHGAFFERYGATSTFAIVMLTTALLARWAMCKGRPDPRVALLGFGIAVLISGLWTAIPREFIRHQIIPTTANSEPIPAPCEACTKTAALDPTLPLVDASGLAFVEMNHRESAVTLSRIFYLTDRDASSTYAHANIFEQMALVAHSFHFAGHVEPYQAFTIQHPHFFVLGTYDYPEDWLLRKLVADGADVRVLGRFDSSYLNKDLYEVKIADHHP